MFSLFHIPCGGIFTITPLFALVNKCKKNLQQKKSANLTDFLLFKLMSVLPNKIIVD